MGKRHHSSCVRCLLMFYVGPFIYFEDTQEKLNSLTLWRVSQYRSESTQPFGIVLSLVYLNFRNQTCFLGSRKPQMRVFKNFLDNS